MMRLTARPTAARDLSANAERRLPVAPGLRVLAAGSAPDVLLYVPADYRADRPAPLAVALHGAGGTARAGLAPLLPHADAAGLVLVAPQAVGSTWDLVWGALGPDVRALDRALAIVFRDVAVDPARVALTGFSDGASYALSLGLANGDLFTRLVAFSPGFAGHAEARGRPSVFVSHGVDDAVLPVDRTSRRIVPELREAGYDVTYREFDGPHTVPAAIAEEAARFVAA